MFRRLYGGDGWSLGRWECSRHEVEEPVEEVATRHEIVIPVSGAFARQRSGREILASPLTAVLADAGDTYTVRHPVTGGDECLVLLLGETALEDLGRATAAVRGSSTPRFRQYDVAVSSAAFVSAVRLLSAAGSGDVLQVESAAARLLDLLLTSSEAPASQAGRSPRAEGRHRTAAARGTAYIASNFRSSISLDEIARAAAYSPFHFARIFRDVTGISPYRSVVLFRLRAAVDRLRRGEDDLSRLALDLGFSSHSHMSAAFRTEFSMAPSEMRAGFR